MNKKFSLLLVILLLIVGGLYYSSASKKDSVINSVSNSNTSSKDNVIDAFKKKKNQKCTWDNGEGKDTGVVYVSGDKFRSEVTGFVNNTNGDNGDATMYALNDGEWIYSWSSDNATGTKIKISDMNKNKAPSDGEKASDDTYTSDELNSDFANELSFDVDYKCESWKVDKSMFVAPTNIDFQDMAAMLEQSKESMKTDMQGYCYSLKDDKEQKDCLKAMESVEFTK